MTTICNTQAEFFKKLPQRLGTHAYGIKFVFPRAPCRTITWSTGDETGVSSWFNYRQVGTCP